MKGRVQANIGISEEHKQLIANDMQKVLADEVVLYIKTRNYHWNIEGDNFMELHKLYQKMYEQMEEFIDDTAERIRTIGHYAQGRLKDFIQQTQLVEQDYTNEQQDQFRNLLDDHETIIRYLRQLVDKFADEYGDAGNADYLTGLMEEHEKLAWFLRNYIQK
ncbi:MAG: DNA starvation/stationary phase protection protein [Sphingobacteriaceae bacterium]|nr:MAG: DNA starvation/stationary phase protection protein [Sphingobacteriaceae bacterium]